ncbi:hypothetical protein C8034_v005826 [Colletotrichum sidae]|uniref:Uncharacterized protein n=1 Tax=Colletotrichum sidae TaxID=1347389 RepID=A0A4R8T658_9PEZI|nr:hypothetical protein C8034_v005826 [Colletotrichum sidae]
MHVWICEDPFSFETEVECECAKRKGVHLLAANRQIHAEAASIFWSRNTFYCLDVLDVIAASYAIIRPAYQRLIPGLSIVSPGEGRHTDHEWEFAKRWGAENYCPDIWLYFWTMIVPFKSLRMLEVDIIMLTINAGWVEKIMSLRPQLAIHTVSLQPFCKTMLRDFSTYPWRFSCDSEAVFYVKMTGPVITAASAALTRGGDALSKLGMDSFFQKEELASRINAGHFDDPNDSPRRPGEWRLPHGFDDDNSGATVTLGDGSQVRVEFYGLPFSESKRRENMRKKRELHENQAILFGTITLETWRECKRFQRKIHLEIKQAAANEAKWKRRHLHAGPYPFVAKVDMERVAAVARRDSEQTNAEARKRERKRIIVGKKHRGQQK